MGNGKGDRRERELVNLLDDYGFAVLRAPASGSATDRALPDILTGNTDNFYAIEAKSSSGNPIYIDSIEIEMLIYFSLSFGAKPRLGIRFDNEDWEFFHPSDAHITNSMNYRVREDRLGQGEKLEELI